MKVLTFFASGAIAIALAGAVARAGDGCAARSNDVAHRGGATSVAEAYDPDCSPGLAPIGCPNDGDGNCGCGLDRACGRGCGRGGDGCGSRCCGLVAGVEATFLKPNIKNDTIHYQMDQIDPPSSRLANFDELEGAPRIWLGFEGCNGWGLRGRYWDFSTNTGSDEFEVARPPRIPGTHLAQAELGLDAYAVDLEMTKRWCGERGSVLAALGVRYAYREIEDSYYFNYSENCRPPYNVTSFNSLFDKAGGTGLTSALEMSRRLGDSGFSVVGNLRGSVLWGSNVSGYHSDIHDDNLGTLQSYQNDSNATTWIGEIQVGVRWERRIECLSANVFSHVVFEYQYWSTDGCEDFEYETYIQTPSYRHSVCGQSLDRNVEFTGLAWAIGITH